MIKNVINFLVENGIHLLKIIKSVFAFLMFIEQQGHPFRGVLFSTQNEQNHQQPGQRMPVEVVSLQQQDWQLGAAPARGGAAQIDLFCWQGLISSAAEV
ncbi:hypothetical protein WG68_06540 [Arsukibacterium ikkense]|uniref:Uncharacterized protein n=1 Tax=Arsukibacterium ikkense TaxID=336831 RepID=A0A0M2V6F0_9GAMM|nr:hypothetical protein [Arsukibacterium ikkense]KKO46417.1 hypothetical protein WG68_06540 [Arsukibacterium ikkense]